MKKIVFALFFFASALAHAQDINTTPSPDSSMVAFTRDNDLWIRNIATGNETRLTDDGSELILNGYASWVYYEEIFGRPSMYRAFWWSPDSRRIAFYRFDNGKVPMFPIYSPFGQDGSLSLTRYPKAGECNPPVRIGIADLGSGSITWADFSDDPEQYFGTPFWGPASDELFVSRMPRRQSLLEVFAVSATDGSKRPVYSESYPTWVTWIEGMLFTDNGLLMARNFETGWEQIYFLGYDGTLKRLTDGPNWDIQLLKYNEKKGDLWFVAKRDSRIHPTLYRLDKKGRIYTLTDPDYYVAGAEISDDFKTFKARVSNTRSPWTEISGSALKINKFPAVAESTEERPVPELVKLQNDGFDLYGLMSVPRGFDPAKKYPVVMQLYGGPGTPYVRDYWNSRDASDRWCWENGIIYIVVDPRSSGENGRAGMDEAFRRMTVPELGDYITWAKWLQDRPYVDGSRIGVEGFSFGGTTTAMLVLRYPEYFCCGVAGGGVYDWKLYDSHYTERFMDTPQANPDGYAEASVITWVDGCAMKERKGLHNGMPALKLTHGTGDDNVHFQNTLQLIDALQRAGIQFELMIYPDGMHGYRGFQHEHDMVNDHLFWTKHLLASSQMLTTTD
ncbi:MAG: DPP IV N-terminal domain-containing protein [Bacteroidales bacterium]|nr:DPP IV N-terminal domain-containing protein [Bacteroidales bacterium]